MCGLEVSALSGDTAACQDPRLARGCGLVPLTRVWSLHTFLPRPGSPSPQPCQLAPSSVVGLTEGERLVLGCPLVQSWSGACPEPRPICSG